MSKEAQQIELKMSKFELENNIRSIITQIVEPMSEQVQMDRQEMLYLRNTVDYMCGRWDWEWVFEEYNEFWSRHVCLDENFMI
jgi:hypothetical protein